MRRAPFIILIEDDREHLAGLERRLEEAGVRCPVLSFWRPDHAMAFLRTAGDSAYPADPPTLILCDLTMPGVDGWNVLRFVKAHPWFQGVAVVVLTDSADSQVAKRARACGADAVLAKFPSVAELVDILAVFGSGVPGVTRP